MDKVRIAVASSDGIVVNQHFGKAELFYIYETDGENVAFSETRALKAVCEAGNHDDNRLLENLNQLRDCEYLLVSRIGNMAESVAERVGIHAFEIPGIIGESIDQLVKYIKIQDLYESLEREKS